MRLSGLNVYLLNPSLSVMSSSLAHNGMRLVDKTPLSQGGVKPRLSQAKLLAGEQRRLFLSGHSHTESQHSERIAKIIVDIEAASIGTGGISDVLKSFYRKDVESHFEKHEEQLRIYKDEIVKIVRLISDPENQIQALCSEVSESELPSLLDATSRRHSLIYSSLQNIDFENAEEAADDLFLILYGPELFLKLKDHAVLRDVKLVGVDDRNLRREGFQHIDRMMAEITKMSRKIGFGHSEEFEAFQLSINKFIEEDHIPSYDEEEGLIASFASESLMMSAINALGYLRYFIDTARRRSQYMAETILGLDGGALYFVGELHVEDIILRLKPDHIISRDDLSTMIYACKYGAGA